MSDQFQHVIVLTSIIIGLGITNVLLGVSGAIERYTEGDRPLQFSWASESSTEKPGPARMGGGSSAWLTS